MLRIILKRRDLFIPLILKTIKWHICYVLRKTPKPLACGIYITNQCNLRCQSCNIWQKPQKKFISKEKAFSIVKELGGIGCFYLSISGGEPLLVPYLPELLRYAKISGVNYTHLVSNGLLLNDEIIARLKLAALDEISISIDGSIHTHDERRCKKGAYEKAMGAIALLKQQAPEIKIVLNTILSPVRPEDCIVVLRLAERMNLFMKCQPFVLHTNFTEGEKGAFDERIYAKKNKDRLLRVIQILKNSKSVINSTSFLKQLEAYFLSTKHLTFRKEKCIFGYHHIEVDEEGNLFPCLEGLRWKRGIFWKGSLKTILKGKNYKNHLNTLSKCTGCNKNMYICYYEPRLSFPIWNFFKFQLFQLS